MAEHAIATLALATALFGCAGDDQAFLLDNLCRNQFGSFDNNGNPISTCALSGDAVFTTGITSDGLAVKMGPAGGALTIALGSIPAVRQASWSFDALAASTRAEGSVLGRPEISWGSCGLTCPGTIGGVEVDLTEDVSWAVLVEAQPGIANATAGLPGDVVITLQGSDMIILDLRTPGFDQNAPLPQQRF